MADAIPVHSEPVRKGPKIKAPQLDKNGVEIPADYVTTVRENLGNPSDFVSHANAQELVTHLQRADGSTYEHRFTREDH